MAPGVSQAAPLSVTVGGHRVTWLVVTEILNILHTSWRLYNDDLILWI